MNAVDSAVEHHNSGAESGDEIALEDYAKFAVSSIEEVPTVNKKRKRKAPKEASTLDEIEEQRRTAFTAGWEESLTTHAALPIKEDGKVIERKVVRQAKKKDEEEETEEPQDDADTEQAKEEAATVSAHRQFFARLMRLDIESARKFIAMTCEDVVVSPERNFRAIVQEDGQKIPSKVDQLLQILDHTDPHIRELAMLSITMIFKDICPGYRIRLPTGKEMQQRVKKDTKKLRDYERRLLMAYQRLLKKLNSVINSGLGNPTRKTNLKSTNGKLGASALRCMCELLRALPHFNFRSNLLETVVKRAAQPNPHITALCTGMFAELFRKDVDGELSFEAARKIAQVLKQRDFEAPEELVTCLHHVKLHVHEDKAHQVRKAAKKERKRKSKSQDDIEEALEESSATANILERDRMQADTLHELTIIYLRVLKSPIGFKLMPAVLEGLSKVAHLINIDTVQDLLEVLRQMMRDTADRIPFPVALQCIRTALCTLQGPGQELTTDETEFISRLYGLLAELPSKPSLTPVAFECIEHCFIKKREVSPSRVAAFCKRLCSIAAHLPHPYNEACLSLAQILITRYSRLQTLLETEDECVASGTSNLHTDDADNSNALGTIAWELPLYMKHVSPSMNHAAARVARQNPLKPTEMPGAIMRNFDDVKVYIQAFNGLEKKQKKQSKRRHIQNRTSSIAADLPDPAGRLSTMFKLIH